MAQPDLFQPAGPTGFSCSSHFLPVEHEAFLLEHIAREPLAEFQYREWTARRRTVSFGSRYDFGRQKLDPAAAIPDYLHPLRSLLAQWAGVDPARFTQASIAEYQAGTQLGWHRDVSEFELIAGVSLQGVARMRFRPYPPSIPGRATYSIDLFPRSAYLIRDAARWEWQHAISPTRELRYSITFRTQRRSGASWG